MKNKLKKSLALMLLIVLSLSNSSIAFAHTHAYTIYKGQNVTYQDQGSNHLRMVDSFYKCSCGDLKLYSSSTVQSHTSSEYTYTGYNYHSGTCHYFELAKYCIQCNHKDSM